MFQPRFLTITGMIAAAALSRVMPHPWNISPVVAMALFGGAHFSNRKWAVLVPLAALFVSDIFLGFYKSMPFIYLAYIAIVFIGINLKNKRNSTRIALASIGSSFLFFIWTNFVVWASGYYTYSWAGLVQCYTAAIPFFRNAFVGDLFFTGLLFGSFYWAENKIPVLKHHPARI